MVKIVLWRVTVVLWLKASPNVGVDTSVLLTAVSHTDQSIIG